MAAIIPDIFTPYIQGVETARQANWQDMQNYNQVQAQQLANAMALATFSPKVQQQYTTAERGELASQLEQATFDYDVQDAYQKMLQTALGTEGISMEAQVARENLDMAIQRARTLKPYVATLTQQQAETELAQSAQQRAQAEYQTANPLWSLGIQGIPGAAGTQTPSGLPTDMSSFGVELTRRAAENAAKAAATAAREKQMAEAGTVIPGIGYYQYPTDQTTAATTQAQPQSQPQPQRVPTFTTTATPREAAAAQDTGTFIDMNNPAMQQVLPQVVVSALSSLRPNQLQRINNNTSVMRDADGSTWLVTGTGGTYTGKQRIYLQGETAPQTSTSAMGSVSTNTIL